MHCNVKSTKHTSSFKYLNCFLKVRTFAIWTGKGFIVKKDIINITI